MYVIALINKVFKNQIATVTFYSEGADEMWNQLIKVPNIAPEFLFPVNGFNDSNNMLIL